MGSVATTEDQKTRHLADIQKREEEKTSRVDDYIENVKLSLLFQPDYHWGDVLSAAPTTINVMGAIFVLSSTPDASAITIHPPDGGFKHMQTYGNETGLNTCLIMISDQGIACFDKANTNMGYIAPASDVVAKSVKRILLALADADTAQQSLKGEVESLRDTAENCEKRAIKISDDFEEWLSAVCELHASVAQTSTDTSAKRKHNETQLLANQTKLKQTQTALKKAEENLATAKATLDVAQNAYKKASDNYPSGWELIGMELVQNLSECLTTTLKQAIPKLIDEYSWTAKAEEVVKISEGVGEDIAKEGFNIYDEVTKTGSAKGGSAGEGKKVVDKSAGIKGTSTNPQPNVVDEDSDDPALLSAGIVFAYVNTLASLLTGVGGSPDWKLLLKPVGTNENPGLDVTLELLQDAANNFKPSEGKASKKLTQVLTTALKVGSELKKTVDSLRSLGQGATTEPPKSDTEPVQGWQKSIKAALDDVRQLKRQASQRDAHPAPTVNPGNSTDGKDGSGAFMDSYLKGAGSRLSTAANSFDVAQEVHQKASDRLVELQVSYGNILTELTTLKADEANLTQIKAVLVKAIELVVELKVKINKLVGFFTAMKTIVEVTVDSQVTPFVKKLENAAEELNKSLGGWTLSQFECQGITTSALSIRAYFELFIDISTMYTTTHTKYIKEGLDLLTDLSTEVKAGDKTKTLQKQNDLKTYGDKSSKGIADFVNKRQAEIGENLKRQAEQANKDLDLDKFGPWLPKDSLDKIKDVGKKQQDTAETGLKESGTTGAKKFKMSGLA